MLRTHSFFLKKTLSGFLALSIILPSIFFLVPTKKAEAFLGIGDITLDPFNLVQNTISAISAPVTAVATPISAATGLSGQVKEYGLDGIGNMIAKMMLRKITTQTVNWINSGFEGNPAFVTDPGQFFLNIGDQAASQMFLGANSPLNQLCTPFQLQVRLALVKTYLYDNDVQYACTFSKIGANFENFTKDFSQGGWQGWFTLTQENQNNPYGSYIQGQSVLRGQITAQQGKYQKQLDWGRGFLSFERCRRDYVPPPDPANRQCTKYSPLVAGGPEPTCLVYEVADPNGLINDECPAKEKETVTPGSVINEQLSTALGSTYAQLEAADEINEIVNALLVQMVSKVFTSVQGGLRSLSESNKGSANNASITQQLQNTLTQAELDKATSTIINNIPEVPVPAPTLTEEQIRLNVEMEKQQFINQYQNTQGQGSNTGIDPQTGLQNGGN